MMEQYKKIVQLGTNLNRLFALCGLKVKPAVLKQPSAFDRFMHMIYKDPVLCEYLGELEAQSRAAVKAAEKQKVILWNERKNKERSRKQHDREKELGQELQKLHSEKLTWIQEMIALRDTLLMKRDYLKARDVSNADAGKLIDGQLKETARILENAGVQILEDTGAFDSSRHRVVRTEPTDDPQLVDTVADVFRPGYKLGEEAIREEEVVLYVDHAD